MNVGRGIGYLDAFFTEKRNLIHVTLQQKPLKNVGKLRFSRVYDYSTIVLRVLSNG